MTAQILAVMVHLLQRVGHYDGPSFRYVAHILGRIPRAIEHSKLQHPLAWQYSFYQGTVGFSNNRDHIIFCFLLSHLPANYICDVGNYSGLRASIIGSWSRLCGARALAVFTVVFPDAYV